MVIPRGSTSETSPRVGNPAESRPVSHPSAAKASGRGIHPPMMDAMRFAPPILLITMCPTFPRGSEDVCSGPSVMLNRTVTTDAAAGDRGDAVIPSSLFFHPINNTMLCSESRVPGEVTVDASLGWMSPPPVRTPASERHRSPPNDLRHHRDRSRADEPIPFGNPEFLGSCVSDPRQEDHPLMSHREPRTECKAPTPPGSMQSCMPKEA